MYNYEDVYEKVIKNTESVNLSAEESIKIIDKVYKDLEIGILKPRNMTKRAQKLICNSLARQFKQKEDLTIENYQVNTFIKKVKPKLVMSDKEFKELEKRLYALADVSEENLEKTLKEYLDEINNESLNMIRNQSFRDLNQAIIAIDNSKLANKYNLYEERILLYGFVDHKYGLLFELLTEENNENHILTKHEVENNVIKFIDKEQLEFEDYGEIRSLDFLDDLRDDVNPDVITVKFIDSGKSEFLKVRLESVVGSKLIGTLIDEPEIVDNFEKDCEVVISYCYDYTDKIHVYVNNSDSKLPLTLKNLSEKLADSSKDVLLENLLMYRNEEEFDFIIDTFHTTIFDYFKDIGDFYSAVNNEVLECI